MSEKGQFSMFPQPPGQTKPGWVARIGANTMASHSFLARLWGTLFGALLAPFQGGSAGHLVARRVLVRQVFFTGFEALPLVSVIALLVGLSFVLQARLAVALPAEMLGAVLVAGVLREVAPLTTAVIVAGRSGTAIATELGNMRANQEVLGLISLGIDPYRFIVFPRMAGTIVSVLVLTVYFGAIAVLGGTAVGLALGGVSLEAVRSGFTSTLQTADLPLFLTKGIGLGVIVGWLCCHFGLEVRASPTEVPRRASQAVVFSLLTCVVFNTATTVLFYWYSGFPVR